MARVTNAEIMELLNNINETLKGFDARITKLENGEKTTTKAKAKTSSKKSDSNDFDREKYETIAKKLGVFYNGKVCATVKDGKVMATAKENREKVYKAMGYKK